jgi:zinc protease
MFRSAACTVLALLAATSLSAQSLRVESETFRLPNGLTVILHRDTTTPTIASNIWYHVGSSHERPGRTGFAHLFEHIMFEGSANVPEGKIDEWFAEVGGAPNGSTNRDRTNYMQSFSSNALDLALFIESDRMGHLLEAMSPASVDGQRDVVKNERRQSYDNRPYGLADQVITEALYAPTHPYSWPVIGYMDHLTAAAYEDVVDFFRTYYAPNNASLAIAGDIDLAEARVLAEKWYADVPQGAPVPALAAAPPVVETQQRLALEDRVQLPRLVMTWVSPAAFADDDAAMDAVAELLAGGKGSRLYQRLVYELQIADDVNAFQGGGRVNGEFEISATARAGHSLQELYDVIVEELARAASVPPATHELERIVNQNEIAFLERLERVATKADMLNMYLFYTGTPDYFEEDLARFRALRTTDLSSAIGRWLDPQRAIVLSVVPQGQTALAVGDSRVVPNENLQLSPSARKEPAT